MRHLIFKVFLFCLPLFMLAIASSRLLDNYFGNILNWRPFEKMEWIMNVKNQNFDYVFIGSSRVKYMVDNPLIDETLHINSINLGTDGSGFADNYLLFNHFLKNGNKTSALVINVDPYVFDSKNSFGYPFHDFFFLPRLDDKSISLTIQEISGFKKWLFWKYVPLSKYFEFNEKFILTFLHRITDEEPNRVIAQYDKNKGADFVYNVLDEPFPDRVMQNFSFSETDEKFFLQMAHLAQESGAEVLLYTAPEYSDIEKFQTGRREIEARIKQLADDNGLTFLKIEDKDIEENPELFRDWLHLNATGTRIFSGRIIDAIK